MANACSEALFRETQRSGRARVRRRVARAGPIPGSAVRLAYAEVAVLRKTASSADMTCL